MLFLFSELNHSVIHIAFHFPTLLQFVKVICGNRTVAKGKNRIQIDFRTFIKLCLKTAIFDHLHEIFRDLPGLRVAVPSGQERGIGIPFGAHAAVIEGLVNIAVPSAGTLFAPGAASSAASRPAAAHLCHLRKLVLVVRCFCTSR